MMRRYLVVLCALALLLGSLPARAAGPAPVRLSPEARERFAAATAFYRAGDWAQAARTGDDAAAAALWRRFLERFPDHAEASRARLRMGQSLVAAGRPAEAATAFRELWLTVPATPWADAAARELRELEARGIAVAAPTPTQRIERAERVATAGLGDKARAEAEAVLADGPPPDLALKALRVVVDAARRAGRDDLALAATTRALGLVTGEKRAPWLLESAKIQQKKNRDGALAALDRLVADYPKAPEADDALLLKARIVESGPDPKAAEAVYLKLAQNYPDSEEGIAAQWRLGWLSWLRSDHLEAAERWSHIPSNRAASQNYRDAALYWTARAQAAAGQTESASKHFSMLVAESPRSYYGVLAARRVPRASAGSGKNPAAVQLAASLPGDPKELLQADAPYARVEALHAVGLDDFADEEMDEIVRRSITDTRRLYALSTAYVQEARYYLALRIMRRHFLGLARSAPPAVPRHFWEVFYPIGWRTELTDAASRAAVDPYLVAAVVREESSYNAQA